MGYQLKPKAEAGTPYQDLYYSGYHKNLILSCFASSLMASNTKHTNLT